MKRERVAHTEVVGKDHSFGTLQLKNLLKRKTEFLSFLHFIHSLVHLRYVLLDFLSKCSWSKQIFPWNSQSVQVRSERRLYVHHNKRWVEQSNPKPTYYLHLWGIYFLLAFQESEVENTFQKVEHLQKKYATPKMRPGSSASKITGPYNPITETETKNW